MGTIKEIVFSACKKVVQEKIDNATGTILRNRDAMNADTKSSMGDKFETTRATLQWEIEKLGKQLKEYELMWEILSRLDPNYIHTEAEAGALVITDSMNFYMAVGVGKLEAEGTGFYSVSPQSPIGKALRGKKAGDKAEVNGKVYKIKEIL